MKNITVAVPDEIYRRARVRAAEQGRSVSALVADYLRSQGDKKAIYAKYEELIAANPEGFDMILDYANELFNETHVSDAKDRPADYAERCIKIEELYKKALALKPDALEANLNLAKHYFNQALFIEEDADKIKGKMGH